ncbi:carbohydate-binding domain-containing protein, partial [Mucilaginibacter polytrichastri]
MRYFLIATFLVFFNVVQAQQPHTPAFNAHDISISWQAVQNDYQGKPQSLNALVITNHGHAALPATGWKLYFNSARGIAEQTVSNNAKIEIVNGDLFTITPNGSFAGIKEGDSTRIDFIGKEPVINLSDSPEGFYVVWDTQPEKGYPIGSFTSKPFKPNYVGLYTPAVIYQQNKIIQDVASAKLTKVFPTPVDYQETAGAFTIDDKTGITADAAFKNEAGYLSAELLGLGIKVSAQKAARSISLKMVPNLGDEGYGLSITPQNITV